jgi:hypothetical protein
MLTKKITLGGMQRALDELHDAEAHAMPEYAHPHAECRRRLALTGAGVDDEQALLILGFNQFLFKHFFVLLGLPFMSFRIYMYFAG